MDNGNMPAMPQSATSDGYSCNYYDYGGPGIPTGLTKREMMAMHIASGFAADNKITTDNVVKWSIEVTDKLLSELERTCQKS